MKKNSWILAVIFIVASTPLFADQVSESTLNDQSSVEVTVYNSNLALVKDTRKLPLSKGEGELRFMDVAAYIMPQTVHVKSLNAPDSFRVLEQNYEYDLMDPQKLLDKYVGKKIKIIDEKQFVDRKETVEAELLSNNNGQAIYKINNEIYLDYPGIRVLPALPENLIAKPTLTWMYDSKSAQTNNMEVSYLTSNMNWKADYVLVLDQQDKFADLSGWVTIDNTSGATYKNAKLKLVAGDVNRIQQAPNVMYEKTMRLASMDAAAAPMFQEQSFFEYHIYDLQRPTTIKDNQTKQINLLEASGIGIQKEYVVYGVKNYYYNYQYNEQNPKQPVNVNVKFVNKEANKLGMPLPKGIVRLYKKDSKDSLQFIGEDNVEHTPKDEEVSLKVGEAFDIVAERKQIDFRQISTNMFEAEWEVKLKNHKDDNIVVGIMEPVPGSWQVISNSHPYEKKDAFTIRFNVPVAKNGEATVKYRIRVGI